ncbi:MAG TPA: hypothetical protein VH351_02435 [Bryobacteraceae bacterium]|jgi:hypothetical protein|nr:hypothetical protein [Bryobacteraceae bacterium]
MRPIAEALVSGKLNDSRLPIRWTNSYTAPSGKTTGIFITSMVTGHDLETAGLRRSLGRAAYWELALEDKIPKAGPAKEARH